MKKIFAVIAFGLALAGCAYHPYYGYGEDNYLYMNGWYGYYGANHTFIHVQHMSYYEYNMMRQRQIMARRTYNYQQRLNSIRSVTISRSWSSSSYRSSYGGGGFRSGRR